MSADRPGRVVFALPLGLSLGGVETWSFQMCRGLKDKGDEPVLVSHSLAGDKQTVVPPPDVPLLNYPAGPALTTRPHVEVLSPLLPATFVPNGSVETYAACAAIARRSADRLRVIGLAHTYDAYYFNLLCTFEPVIHRFIAVSEECAAVLTQRLPHRAADVILQPYGVEVPETLTRSWSPANAPLRLLYAGRIEQRQKRALDLLVLARALDERKVQFHLDIVGEGGDKPLLLQQHAALPAALRERISIRPSVRPEQVPPLLEEHDVCVLVSAYEGTSIFMLEGLSHGCIPVVTDVSGTARVIEQGVNGFRTPVSDVAAMADVLARLDRDRGLLETIGRAAHRSAERYSSATYLTWFRALTTEIWQEPPRRWPGRLAYPLPLKINRTARAIARRVPGLWPLVRAMRRNQ